VASYSPRLARQVAEVVRALWFVPAVMTIAGMALGLVMPGIDAMPGVLRELRLGWVRTVLDSAPAGAQQVLATSAGALATVLGVAFSLTLVTLQLATAQYTPRIIGRLLEDRVTKIVLGGFIGTVAYLLLVLRSVHGVGDGQSPFVPRLSMALGLVLFLGCLGLLAYFVHHLGGSIQAASLASRVAHQTMDALANLRRSEGEPVPGPTHDLCPEAHSLVHADRHGFVQLVDGARLAEALPEGISHAQVLVAAGDFVLPDQPLLAFWPPRPLTRDETVALQRAVALGEERTEDQDVLYGVRLLADIGLKALSPSLNDETTAVTAVNQLGAVLAAAGREGEGSRWRRYPLDGRTVFLPGLTLRRMVEDGFGGLIRFSAEHPRVLARIAEVFGELSSRMPPCDGRDALLEAAGWVERVARDAELAPHERRLVAKRLEALRTEGERSGANRPHPMH
jgi:uncharacterized membrane protein